MLIAKNKLEMMKKLLTSYPSSKDSDYDLISRVWYYELLDMNIPKEEAAKFCRIIQSGSLSLPEGLTRCRRKLQEKDEEYRGFKYNARIERSNKIKKEIVKL
tara:strand:- start:740 stop:1045 length:306 start_codon:yes stop_codon:yes gene_type:complete